MKRTYELCFIVEPQRTDDESKAICEKYKKVIEGSGATIDHVWEWGKRKLAYPIQNLKEGIYWVIYVTLEGKTPWPDVERLMTQDEHVLRYLVVRTDEDLERAKRGKVQPTQPWEAAAESR
jgi:small subunit ribosomal protein S6